MPAMPLLAELPQELKREDRHQSGREWIPRGSIVVPFWGSYLESYKVIPKRNYYGAYRYLGGLSLLEP